MNSHPKGYQGSATYQKITRILLDFSILVEIKIYGNLGLKLAKRGDNFIDIFLSFSSVDNVTENALVIKNTVYLVNNICRNRH